VIILVAGDAGGGYAEVSTGEILNLDGRALLGRDMRWDVALVAVQSGVLALQRVSGFLVIKSLDVPLDQRKIDAVVLGVAAGALLAGAGRNVIGGVQSCMSREPDSNFGMTLQALQLSLAAELMALGAVGGSAEELVWAGERAGRDLRCCGPNRNQACQQRGHQ